MKKLIAALLVLCMTLSLCACGGKGSSGSQEPESKEAAYTVKVVDAVGNPYTDKDGVIVKILKAGEQVAMQPLGADGTVSKTLEKGDYTVELVFTDSEASYVYDTSAMTLSGEKTELTVELYFGQGESTYDLMVGNSVHTAYYVSVGSTKVALDPQVRSYFLFAPTEAGTYDITVKGEGLTLGNYGIPYVVQDQTISEVTDNTFTLSLSKDMVGSGDGSANIIVVGIDSESAEDCILTVTRTGDPQLTVEDTPMTVYAPTVALTPYTLPADASMVDFDLTASSDTYKLVLNEADGFYHLNSQDGPLVLVRLGVDSKYMSSYKMMLEKTGIRKYFYDENGTCVRREDYYDCLAQYIGRTDPNGSVQYEGVMDKENGVYPLTEDLKYIIQNHGGHCGWWDLDSNTSLFRDDDGNALPGINEEIAWLFMCCYIAQ